MNKQNLHRLVDELPEKAVVLAIRLLEVARDTTDPLLLALENAPLDDEPTTPEEDARAHAARLEMERGEGIRDEDLDREFAQ